MPHKTVQISFPESHLPKTGNVLVVSEATGEILGKATTSELPDTPRPFLRVSPDYFDLVNSSMWKAPAVLKVAAHIMAKLRYQNLINLNHRKTAVKIGIAVSTFSKCLADLQKAVLIAHRKDLGLGTYMVNPRYVWYGSSRDIPRAVKEFTAARKASGYFVEEDLPDSTSASVPDDTE